MQARGACVNSAVAAVAWFITGLTNVVDWSLIVTVASGLARVVLIQYVAWFASSALIDVSLTSGAGVVACITCLQVRVVDLSVRQTLCRADLIQRVEFHMLVTRGTSVRCSLTSRTSVVTLNTLIIDLNRKIWLASLHTLVLKEKLVVTLCITTRACCDCVFASQTVIYTFLALIC